ncbi:MAG: cytochrome B6 [gamma proteobacterium symbiont of Ctena orbiculata]|nr:MAG: cytochrome B6 [gamma proteobacterium symbiont of Ctena orbiculata]
MLNLLKINFLFLLCLSMAIAAGVKHEPIRPLVIDPDLDPRMVSLGDKLFHDTRLSQDNSISCSSCHILSTGGADRKSVSVGIGGAVGGIKAPTVYNATFNFVQFWDGRAASLEQQAAGPVHNPMEMNSNWEEVISKLEQDPVMMEEFDALFDDGITEENISTAIATFEHSLVTLNSRFDRWLQGEQGVLTEQELRGYRLFKSYGCISCHQGMNVGGNMYGFMGAMGDYFKDRQRPITTADMGRYNVTKNSEDRHYFKVPSLRLAAINPPYFHDGSETTLKGAVRIMGRYQLGRELPERDIEDIVAFLHSLVGEHIRLKP